MKLEYLENGSPDCPLVRIYGTDRAEFSALRDVSRRLANGDGGPFSVGDIPGFSPVNECALEIVASSKDAGVQRIGTVSFRWELRTSNWWTVAGLIEPFAHNATGERYQWLSGKEARHGLGIGQIAVLISSSREGRW